MPSRTPPQARYDNSPHRFNLSLWGRQSGKTTIGYRKLIWKPIKRSNTEKWGTYWHILQTYAAADIVFDRYLRLIHPFRDQILKYKNESERRVELIKKTNVFFKSGQNFEDLRTESLDGCIIDEARQQKKELWSMVVFPMLSKSKGWADLMSSPNGFDWLYDLKVEKEKDDSWGVIQAPSTEAWWWTPEEILEAKKNMTDLEFRQEIMAEFVNIRSGKAYVCWGEHNHALECPFLPGKLFSPYHSIVCGMDFNLSPMSWTLGQMSAEKSWWFDEIYLKNSHTLEAAKELRDRILHLKNVGYRAEPNLILCGDATGKATQRSSNQSDYDIVKQVLKDAGITYRDETPESNPSIKDRVNGVNVKCKNARGETDLWVHPLYCPNLVKDMDRVAWKEGSDFILDPGPKKDLTHPSDSIGYPIMCLQPPRLINNIGRTRVIQRII